MTEKLEEQRVNVEFGFLLKKIPVKTVVTLEEHRRRKVLRYSEYNNLTFNFLTIFFRWLIDSFYEIIQTYYVKLENINIFILIYLLF